METKLRIRRPPIPNGEGSHFWFEATIYTAKSDGDKMDVYIDGKLAVKGYPLEIPTKLPKDKEYLNRLAQRAEKNGRTIHEQLVWYEMNWELTRLANTLQPIYCWAKKIELFALRYGKEAT